MQEDIDQRWISNRIKQLDEHNKRSEINSVENKDVESKRAKLSNHKCKQKEWHALKTHVRSDQINKRRKRNKKKVKENKKGENIQAKWTN